MAGLLTLTMLTSTPLDLVAEATRSSATPPEVLSYGDAGLWAQELNRRLLEVGFHADADATFGKQTRHAVYAFQKHHGLETDGEFTDAMWPLLDEHIELPARREPNRVEADLGKQVLYLVEEGEVTMIVPISSANGGTYRNKSGSLARAVTPEGKFEFERHINGWRRSYLGLLYKPFYFRGGYAIHGSYSVPNYPASHGCIRLTLWDMDVVKSKIDLGWTFYAYGKRTDPPEPYVAPEPPSFVL